MAEAVKIVIPANLAVGSRKLFREMSALTTDQLMKLSGPDICLFTEALRFLAAFSMIPYSAKAFPIVVISARTYIAEGGRLLDLARQP